jgi:hypothetical protein
MDALLYLEPIGKIADPIPDIVKPPVTSPRHAAWAAALQAAIVAHAAGVTHAKAKRRLKKLARETAKAARDVVRAQTAAEKARHDVFVSNFKLASLR